MQNVIIKEVMAIDGRSFMKDLRDSVLVGDGAMGTMLYMRGAFLNKAFEELNTTDPESVAAIHRAYVDAGADIIETNTFGANRIKLDNFGLRQRLPTLNAAGVALARTEAGGTTYVAAAIGPLGAPFTPDGPLLQADAENVFREQAEALLDPGGVDLFMLETFHSMVELRLAVQAIRAITTLPIVAQLTTDVAGQTSDGIGPEMFAPVLVDDGADVIGVNCSEGPVTMLEIIERLGVGTEAPLAAQPNAGRPREVEGRTLYLSSPEFVASYARRFVSAGAKLVGGCCGTTPDHIRAIKAAVDVACCDVQTGTL